MANVRQMIEALQQLPPDALVVKCDYSKRVPQFDHVEQFMRMVYVKPSSNTNNDFFREADQGEPDAVLAVEI